MTPVEIAAEIAKQDLPAQVSTVCALLYGICDCAQADLTTGQVSDVDMALMYVRHFGKGLGASLP